MKVSYLMSYLNLRLARVIKSVSKFKHCLEGNQRKLNTNLTFKIHSNILNTSTSWTFGYSNPVWPVRTVFKLKSILSWFGQSTLRKINQVRFYFVRTIVVLLYIIFISSEPFPGTFRLKLNRTMILLYIKLLSEPITRNIMVPIDSDDRGTTVYRYFLVSCSENGSRLYFTCGKKI